MQRSGSGLVHGHGPGPGPSSSSWRYRQDLLRGPGSRRGSRTLQTPNHCREGVEGTTNEVFDEDEKTHSRSVSPSSRQQVPASYPPRLVVDSIDEGKEGRYELGYGVGKRGIRSSNDGRTYPLSARETGLTAGMTPVPYAKMSSLFVSRVAEGMIYSVILPYINEMIHGLGVAEKDVGVWSATAVSSEHVILRSSVLGYHMSGVMILIPSSGISVDDCRSYHRSVIWPAW